MQTDDKQNQLSYEQQVEDYIKEMLSQVQDQKHELDQKGELIDQQEKVIEQQEKEYEKMKQIQNHIFSGDTEDIDINQLKFLPSYQQCLQDLKDIEERKEFEIEEVKRQARSEIEYSEEEIKRLLGQVKTYEEQNYSLNQKVYDVEQNIQDQNNKLTNLKRQHQSQLQIQEKNLIDQRNKENEELIQVKLKEAKINYEKQLQERLEAISNNDNRNIQEFKIQFMAVKQEKQQKEKELDEIKKKVLLREEKYQELEQTNRDIEDDKRKKEGEIITEKKRTIQLENQWEEQKRSLENIIQKQRKELEMQQNTRKSIYQIGGSTFNGLVSSKANLQYALDQGTPLQEEQPSYHNLLDSRAKRTSCYYQQSYNIVMNSRKKDDNSLTSFVPSYMQNVILETSQEEKSIDHNRRKTVMAESMSLSSADINTNSQNISQRRAVTINNKPFVNSDGKQMELQRNSIHTEYLQMEDRQDQVIEQLSHEQNDKDKDTDNKNKYNNYRQSNVSTFSNLGEMIAQAQVEDITEMQQKLEGSASSNYETESISEEEQEKDQLLIKELKQKIVCQNAKQKVWNVIKAINYIKQQPGSTGQKTGKDTGGKKGKSGQGISQSFQQQDSSGRKSFLDSFKQINISVLDLMQSKQSSKLDQEDKEYKLNTDSQFKKQEQLKFIQIMQNIQKQTIESIQNKENAFLNQMKQKQNELIKIFYQ